MGPTKSSPSTWPRDLLRHFDGHLAVGEGQGLLGGDARGAAVALEVVGVR